MKVWIDLSNSPHPLLFEPVARRLAERGDEVRFTVRDNAQTIELARERWPTAELIGGPSPEGRLRKAGTIAGRALELARWARRERPDVALSHNSYAQTVAARLTRIPAVTAMDFEHQPANHVAFRTANRILLPEALPPELVRRQGASPRKVVRYPGLKEELALANFDPDPNVLESLGVERRAGEAIVLVRTPPAGATYHRFGNPIFADVLRALGSQEQVQLIVLPRVGPQADEVVKLGLPRVVVPRRAVDSRSLMCAADLFVGAGGTMTREAALLGIPTYSLYAGDRPAVDRWLEGRGALRHLESAEGIEAVRPRADRAPDLEELRRRASRIEEVFVGVIDEVAG